MPLPRLSTLDSQPQAGAIRGMDRCTSDTGSAAGITAPKSSNFGFLHAPYDSAFGAFSVHHESMTWKKNYLRQASQRRPLTQQPGPAGVPGHADSVLNKPGQVLHLAIKEFSMDGFRVRGQTLMQAQVDRQPKHSMSSWQCLASAKNWGRTPQLTLHFKQPSFSPAQVKLGLGNPTNL